MAATTVYPSQDTTGVADALAINTAFASYDTVNLAAGQYYIKASTLQGGVYSGVQVPPNKGLVGAGSGSTTIDFVAALGTSASCITGGAANSVVGLTIQGMTINGGRGTNGVTVDGACIKLAGQGNYVASNFALTDIIAIDGPTQNIQLNSCHTGTVTNVRTSATQAPMAAAHGFDIDAVALNKPTTAVTFTDCSFDSYSQEGLKAENATTLVFNRCTFLQYVTLRQDTGTGPYSNLGPVTFNDCTFSDYITLNDVKNEPTGLYAGSGVVNWNRCTFDENGVIIGADSVNTNYGVQTIADCTFHRNGNSYHYPAGVTITASGNLNVSSVKKRFVRPSLSAKHTPTGGYITGAFAYMARRGSIAVIDTVVNDANTVNGDEVWCLDGTYPASVSGNKGVNCKAKSILLRSETLHGAILDGTSGSAGSQGFSITTADPAGARIWGFHVTNFTTGGSGAGVILNSASAALTIANVKVTNCTASNGGAALRVTLCGNATVEDFIVDACTNTGAGGGAMYAQPSANTFTLRRFKITNCSNTSATQGGGAIRLAHTGTAAFVIEDGQIVDNDSSVVGVGGIEITSTVASSVTIRNVTMAGNTGVVAGDIRVPNTASVPLHTGWDNLICRSGTVAIVRAGGTTTVTGDNSNIIGLGSSVYSGSDNFDTAEVFTDLANDDVSLAATSPSIASGKVPKTARSLNYSPWGLDGVPFNTTAPSSGGLQYVA